MRAFTLSVAVITHAADVTFKESVFSFSKFGPSPAGEAGEEAHEGGIWRDPGGFRLPGGQVVRRDCLRRQ